MGEYKKKQSKYPSTTFTHGKIISISLFERCLAEQYTCKKGGNFVQGFSQLEPFDG